MSSIIHKVFNKAKSEETREATIPISELPSPTSSFGSSPGILASNWVFSSAQSVGRIREHNEDAVFSLATSFSVQGRPAKMALFIVADGMGGHANGEQASKLAVQVVAEKIFQNYLQPTLSDYRTIDLKIMQKILLEAVQAANQAVKKQVAGGGTTLTALWIIDDQYATAHVGDSRLYYLDSNFAIKALTHDHSYVQQLVDVGYLTQHEAELHPQRNILSMALGQLEPLTPEIGAYKLPDSGYFLLCSDGLWGVIDERDMIQTVKSGDKLNSICQKLVELANQAGGPDNISVIMVQIPG